MKESSQRRRDEDEDIMGDCQLNQDEQRRIWKEEVKKEEAEVKEAEDLENYVIKWRTLEENLRCATSKLRWCGKHHIGREDYFESDGMGIDDLWGDEEKLKSVEMAEKKLENMWEFHSEPW